MTDETPGIWMDFRRVAIELRVCESTATIWVKRHGIAVDKSTGRRMIRREDFEEARKRDAA